MTTNDLGFKVNILMELKEIPVQKLRQSMLLEDLMVTVIISTVQKLTWILLWITGMDPRLTLILKTKIMINWLQWIVLLIICIPLLQRESLPDSGNYFPHLTTWSFSWSKIYVLFLGKSYQKTINLLPSIFRKSLPAQIVESLFHKNTDWKDISGKFMIKRKCMNVKIVRKSFLNQAV